jgi:hypothetical protein
MHLWNTNWCRVGAETLDKLQRIFESEGCRGYYEGKAKNPTGKELKDAMSFLGY